MMKDFDRPTQARFALSAGFAVLLAAGPAFAQAPAPAPVAPAAPKAAPVAPKPAPAAPAAQKAAPAAPAAQKAAPAAPAAAKQAAAPAAPAGPPPEWLKVCGKDEGSKTELCSVASYILDGQGNVRGQIRVLDVTRDKEKKRIIEAMIPPGFLIQPGINLVIDDNKTPIPGRYRICFTNACVTEVLVSDDMLANIRKGTTLNIFFANQKGEWLGARVALAGFGAAYDGKPLDPKVAEEKRKGFEDSQNKLQSELAKRAEEQRKKLQEGAAPTAPAALKTQ
jgi:invasion protein IalB